MGDLRVSGCLGDVFTRGTPGRVTGQGSDTSPQVLSEVKGIADRAEVTRNPVLDPES
jgi:hypothetical protein